MSAACRALLLASLLLAAVTNARAESTGGPRQSPGRLAAFPEAPGRDVTVRICLDCHSTSDFTNRRESRFRWAVIVDDMIGEGAKINDREFETLVVYLSVAFGKRVKINDAPATVVAETFDFAAEWADKIVKHRTERGPFKSWQEIAAIPGIDATRVEEQKANLDFTAGRRPGRPAEQALVSSGAASAPRR